MKQTLLGCCVLIFLILISTGNIYCQDPLIEWDNTIGGNGSDFLVSSFQTSDGGYILGGYSNSTISGDKTEYIGNYDYWVVKLNASGSIEWQNAIGTTAADYLTSIIQTADGGYLAGGYTTGGISGDKTNAAIGGKDYWILKLTSTGIIVWQKTIGGSGDDVLTDIASITGGGFILSGYSNSGISGNKTQPCLGGYDYWIIKINSTGIIQWQFTIGGNDTDYLMKTIRASDGTYVLAGYSYSGISGNKTEENIGGYDYWVLAIDGSGSILWQSTIGGSGYDYLKSICELNTGGFILGGYSKSNISGNKSENSLNYSDYCWVCEHYTAGDGDDYWIVKIDEDGDLVWENSFLTGGEWSNAAVTEVFQFSDNKILIAGNSEGYAENLESDGGDDYWLVAIDTNGFMIWQDALGGEIDWVEDEYDWIIEHGDNELNSCFQTSDGGFFVAGSSNGLAGNNKSESAVGGGDLMDYWVLKLEKDNCIPQPVYNDADQDGEGGSLSHKTCELTAGPWVSNSNDCNDLFSSVNSAAMEICDGLDNNCNGLIDEGIIDCYPGPELLWDKSLGDANYNQLEKIISTNDGGTISIGSISSVAFNSSPTNIDIELFRLDASGNLVWHKIITADAIDEGVAIQETSDGGFILGSISSSGISGDKTIAGFGNRDYWIIKLNNAGDIEWQTVIGGSSSDYLNDIQLFDDKIIVIGHSYSGISGNKSEAAIGGADIWILELDSGGNIIWQNTIGGTSSETSPVIAVDNEGQIIVAATSGSSISGDKTEPSQGSDDYWILKLNSSGELIWQNTIGGASTDVATSVAIDFAGNVLVGGYSYSGFSGDKTETHLSNDYWIVKINPYGVLVWENTYLGISYDYCNSIIVAPDGNYILGGYSKSSSGYDKVEPYNNVMKNFYALLDEERNDYWILKIGTGGNILWQNTIGGNMGEYLSSITIDSSGSIYLGGYSKSDLSGNKTSNSFGVIQEVIEIYDWEDEETEYYPNTDFWIVKLQPETCMPGAEFCNSLDDNCNGSIDEGVIETISISAAGATTFCQGGSVLLSAIYSGAAVQWKKNGSDIAGATSSTYSATKTGNYSAVTISPCGTSTSSSISITVNKNPNASISAGGPTSFCEGGSVTLTEIAVVGCTYQWYKGPTSIPGATGLNYVATTPGNYKCRVTKTATGCLKNSNVISVTVPCKEGEWAMVSGEMEFNIYPNPNNGTFEISAQNLASASPFHEGGLRGMIVDVYNSLGQLIYSQQINSSGNNFSETISIDNILSGIYFVRVGDGNNYAEQKLIIEK